MWIAQKFPDLKAGLQPQASKTSSLSSFCLLQLLDLFNNPVGYLGLSKKFEKLVRTASLVRHLRTVSTKQEQMRGLSDKQPAS
jgi:hypothetical protein